MTLKFYLKKITNIVFLLFVYNKISDFFFKIVLNFYFFIFF